MIKHPLFGMNFLEIIETENMTMLALHDRCSPIILKPFQINFSLAGYPQESIAPIVYSVVRDKSKPLMYFLSSSTHYPCIKTAININMTYTPEGHNILHLAVTFNSIKCVQCIAEYTYPSDYINTPLNKSQNTPLHLAINQGNLTIIETLLKYGADPFLKNASNDTPFHLALNSNLDAAKMIGKHIIDQDPELMANFLADKYCRNRTALKIFTMLKRNDVVELLTEFQKTIENCEPKKKTPRCTVSFCNNCKKLRKCHICSEYFCPKHIDMHFHNGNDEYTTEEFH